MDDGRQDHDYRQAIEVIRLRLAHETRRFQDRLQCVGPDASSSASPFPLQPLDRQHAHEDSTNNEDGPGEYRFGSRETRVNDESTRISDPVVDLELLSQELVRTRDALDQRTSEVAEAESKIASLERAQSEAYDTLRFLQSLNMKLAAESLERRQLDQEQFRDLHAQVDVHREELEKVGLRLREKEAELWENGLLRQRAEAKVADQHKELVCSTSELSETKKHHERAMAQEREQHRTQIEKMNVQWATNIETIQEDARRNCQQGVQDRHQLEIHQLGKQIGLLRNDVARWRAHSTALEEHKSNAEQESSDRSKELAELQAEMAKRQATWNVREEELSKEADALREKNEDQGRTISSLQLQITRDAQREVAARADVHSDVSANSN